MGKPPASLPKHGGVSTVGGRDGRESRVVLEGAQAARQGGGPVAGLRAAPARLQRSDEAKLTYEALVNAGRVDEARALQRQGRTRTSPRVSPDQAVRGLMSSGRAKTVDGQAIAPGAPVPRVLEGPVPTRAGPRGNAATWTHPHLGTFTLNIMPGIKNDREASWRAGVGNSLNILLLAFHELLTGGDPNAVFEAYGFKFADSDGRGLFPIAPENIAWPPRVQVDAYVADTAPAAEDVFLEHLEEDPTGLGFVFGAGDDAVEHFQDGYDEPARGMEAALEGAGGAPTLADLLRNASGDDLRAALDTLGRDKLMDLGFDVPPDDVVPGGAFDDAVVPDGADQ